MKPITNYVVKNLYVLSFIYPGVTTRRRRYSSHSHLKVQWRNKMFVFIKKIIFF